MHSVCPCLGSTRQCCAVTKLTQRLTWGLFSNRSFCVTCLTTVERFHFACECEVLGISATRARSELRCSVLSGTCILSVPKQRTVEGFPILCAVRPPVIS